MLGLAPNGGVEDELGKRLDEIISLVRERRRPALTRRQAVAARQLAADALEAGWEQRLIVQPLIETSAFTGPALTFAVDQLRRQAITAAKSKLRPETLQT